MVCKASKMKSWLYSLVFMNNIAALGFAMSLNYVFHHFETCSFLLFRYFWGFLRNRNSGDGMGHFRLKRSLFIGHRSHISKNSLKQQINHSSTPPLPPKKEKKRRPLHPIKTHNKSLGNHRRYGQWCSTCSYGYIIM